MTAYETIVVEPPEPRIARIVMNRPEARNSAILWSPWASAASNGSFTPGSSYQRPRLLTHFGIPKSGKL